LKLTFAKLHIVVFAGLFVTKSRYLWVISFNLFVLYFAKEQIKINNT